VSATRVAVAPLTPEGFASFGTIGMPQGDGAHNASDVPLDLSQGRPRFYIMRLAGRKDLTFDRMARHDRVTQCLGTTDGLPWLIAVAPAEVKEPGLADIRAFASRPTSSSRWRAEPGMPGLISLRRGAISTISSWKTPTRLISRPATCPPGSFSQFEHRRRRHDERRD
jgi:hypothetical protein